MCVLGILSILRLKNKTTLLSLFFSALSLLVHLFLVTFSLSGFLFFSPEFVLRINCLEENGLERCFFFFCPFLETVCDVPSDPSECLKLHYISLSILPPQYVCHCASQ